MTRRTLWGLCFTIGVLARPAAGDGAIALPRMTTACVALLTSPTLMSAGVGRPPEAIAEATADLLPARVIPHPKIRSVDWFERMETLFAKLHVDTKVTEFTREITGEAEIATFLESARDTSRALEAELERPNRAPTKFWTRGRAFSAALSAAVPALFVYMGLEQASVIAHSDVLSHWPILLGDGLLFYLTRRSWKRTVRNARALFDPAIRVRLQNADGDRALTAAVFSDFVASGRAKESPRHFDSGYFYAILTTKLHALLMDPPQADADPRERANYDELLVDALTGALKADAEDVVGLARVDLKYFVDPQTEVPHLVVAGKTMMQTLKGRPKRRTKVGQTETSAVPDAAWSPVRVRAQ